MGKITSQDVLRIVDNQIVTSELKQQIAELLHTSMHSVNYHILELVKNKKVKLSLQLQQRHDKKVGRHHKHVRSENISQGMTLTELVDVHAYLIERDRIATRLEAENALLRKNIAEFRTKAEELDQLNKKLRAVQAGSVVLHSD